MIPLQHGNRGEETNWPSVCSLIFREYLRYKTLYVVARAIARSNLPLNGHGPSNDSSPFKWRLLRLRLATTCLLLSILGSLEQTDAHEVLEKLRTFCPLAYQIRSVSPDSSYRSADSRVSKYICSCCMTPSMVQAFSVRMISRNDILLS